jgi:hypothetical protein
MPATRAQARDQILALAKAVVDTNSLTAFWDKVGGDPPADDPPKSWARINLRHGPRSQANLAGDGATRRYTSVGLLTIQVMAPSDSTIGTDDSLVAQFIAAYSGKTTSGGVWFRNVRGVEVGEDGAWFQTNVYAEFEYDEIV